MLVLEKFVLDNNLKHEHKTITRKDIFDDCVFITLNK